MGQRTLSQSVPSSAYEQRLLALESYAETTRPQATQIPAPHLSALATLGQAYLETSNVPKALTQFEEGLELAQSLHLHADEARFWGLKGMALRGLGNAHFAQRALFRSLALAKETSQTALVIDTLIQIGQLQAETGQQARAISHLEQAYGIATQAEEHVRQMLAAAELGNLFSVMDAPDKALEYFSAALTTAGAAGNSRAICTFQARIGDVLLSQQDYAGAQEAYEAALPQAGSPIDAVQELRALNGLLRTHIGAGQVTLATVYGDRVVQLAREINDSAAELVNLNLLASFLLGQGQNRKALPYLERGLAIAQSQEDWAWQLTLLTHLGHAHHQNEGYPQALNNYRQALRWAEQLQDRHAAAQLTGRIGAVLADLQESEAAVTTAQRALDLALELGDPKLVGEQQILLAFLYHDLGNEQQARAFCRQAIVSFDTAGDASFADKARAFLTEIA